MANSVLFKANAKRVDPYKNFRFKVLIDGKYVAGCSKISVFRRSTEVVKFRAGGDPSVVRLSPGQTAYDAITLEQGVTYDWTFEQWANKIWDYQNSLTDGTADVSLADFRKDITIEVYNESGQKAIAYNVYRCWVSEYQALSELDGSGNAAAISSIKLENEGWQRDQSVTEPTETTYNDPSSL